MVPGGLTTVTKDEHVSFVDYLKEAGGVRMGGAK
jgi:hypothetical protein